MNTFIKTFRQFAANSNQQQSLSLYKPVTFNIDGPLSFGSLTQFDLYSLFADGRVLSRFLELEVQNRFKSLRFVDGHYVDWYSNVHGVIEGKLVSEASGLSFCPSSAMGVGRKVTEADRAQALDRSFLIMDGRKFPEITVTLVRGEDLAAYCTNKNMRLTAKQWDKFLNLYV